MAEGRWRPLAPSPSSSASAAAAAALRPRAWPVAATATHDVSDPPSVLATSRNGPNTQKRSRTVSERTAEKKHGGDVATTAEKCTSSARQRTFSNQRVQRRSKRRRKDSVQTTENKSTTRETARGTTTRRTTPRTTPTPTTNNTNTNSSSSRSSNNRNTLS